LINYLALLGWTPADGREVLTRDDMVRTFTIERLSASPSRFDLKKMQWLNGQHMRMLPVENLRDRVVPMLQQAGFNTAAKSISWLTQMTAICQEKIKTLNEIVQYTDFFFVEPKEYEEKAVQKLWRVDGAAECMTTVLRTVEGLAGWSAGALKQAYEALAEQAGQPIGHYIHPTRLALTGKSVGPGLFELAELLGKAACVARIGRAIEYIKNRREGTS
jgi:glutamyl-tRNA synthetase